MGSSILNPNRGPVVSRRARAEEGARPGQK